MGIRTKFNLSLLLVFTVGLTVSGYISYTLLQKNAREAILQKAGVMMGAASAVRHYTVTQIRPNLEMQMIREFLPQSVPAYAATETFNKLRELYPDYTYKEATLNPTNPRDRAVDWEADLVNEFRKNPEHKELVGTRDTPSGPSLYLARPIQIKDAACLICHSTPDQAPETMIKRYGNANGFNWQLNEIIGAQVVSVPMTLSIEAANQAFQGFIASLVGVFTFVFIVLNVLLGRIVVKPISELSNLADQISTGNLDLPEFNAKGNDEVAVLGGSFNRMRRSLDQALKMLEE